MSFIIESVSRDSDCSTGRLSALSAMPAGCATQARKDLSALTLAKLTDGLSERGITRNLSDLQKVQEALDYTASNGGRL